MRRRRSSLADRQLARDVGVGQLKVGQMIDDPVIPIELALMNERSDDGRAELVYLPTWKSNTDSAGFFFLRVVDSRQEQDGIIRVRSLGNGSKRWFAIDSNQEIEDQLKQLAAALKDS